MTAQRENNGGAPDDRVLKWLPLMVIALVSAVAWGSQMTTTQEHERRITHNENILAKLMETQSRIDERMQSTGADVKENKALMLEILREFRNGRNR